MRRNTEALMAIQAFTKKNNQIIRQVGEQYGLTAIEANIISFLQNNPGRDTASDIIELRGFSKAIVSQGIDQLVKKGMLTRTAEQKDRRVMHLALTAEAGPICDAVEQSRKQFTADCFSGFTENEKQMYLALTDRILVNLNERK